MRKVALLATLLGTGVLAVGAVAVANDDDGSGRNGGQAQRLPGSDSISTTGVRELPPQDQPHEQSVDYTLVPGP